MLSYINEQPEVNKIDLILLYNIKFKAKMSRNSEDCISNNNHLHWPVDTASCRGQWRCHRRRDQKATELPTPSLDNRHHINTAYPTMA